MWFIWFPHPPDRCFSLQNSSLFNGVANEFIWKQFRVQNSQSIDRSSTFRCCVFLVYTKLSLYMFSWMLLKFWVRVAALPMKDSFLVFIFLLFRPHSIVRPHYRSLVRIIVPSKFQMTPSATTSAATAKKKRFSKWMAAKSTALWKPMKNKW